METFVFSQVIILYSKTRITRVFYILFANCILSFNKLRNVYKILDDMKYALISGASSGLAKEVINLIEDDYFILP